VHAPVARKGFRLRSLRRQGQGNAPREPGVRCCGWIMPYRWPASGGRDPAVSGSEHAADSALLIPTAATTSNPLFADQLALATLARLYGNNLRQIESGYVPIDPQSA